MSVRSEPSARRNDIAGSNRRLMRASGGAEAGGLSWHRQAAGESLVIVGGGMTGFKLCERVQQLAAPERYRITLIGEEPVAAYDRVNLHRYFSSRSIAALQLAPLEWYREKGVQLITGDPVERIRRDEHCVMTRSGRRIGYDRLVLATGSKAYVPPMQLDSRERVLVYRSVDDLDRMLQLATGSRSVIVIGGGMLGIEAARSLHDLRLEVTIVDNSTGLLARYLPPEAAAIFNRRFAGLGIHILTSTVTERISSTDESCRLYFLGGGERTADFVVMATGIRPRDELAADCGLDLGHRGGIKVDDRLQTSDPDVFAIGECACHRQIVYGLAAPGRLMAEVLAANLAGARQKFTGADQSCSLKLPECPVQVIGEHDFNGSVHAFADDRHYRQLVFRGGRVVGAVVVGEWSELPRVREAVDSRRRIWAGQVNEFLATGLLWRTTHVDAVSLWPAGAVVCNCMKVTRGMLSKAMADGCSSWETLSEKTGASKVCGSCRPLLAQLLGEPAEHFAGRGWRWLLGAAALAVTIVLMLLVVPPLEPANTVQGGWRFETLWRNAFWKQITGFTMLGLIVVSLTLTLRKRLGAVRWGEFGWWRVMHSSVGLASIVVLITHTGLSLGKNLNFVLMFDFLALGVWGGLAGLVTSLEHRFTGYLGRRIRQTWTWLHVALFWPLPALITFHILSVYWF